jgi:DNA-binding transcriptional regulator YhcF (GntR family)
MTFELQLTVALADPTPPYEQVRRQLAGHIQAGRLAPGARLPSVRQLAADLGLAAGTVARAYRELEEAGLITTGRARGTHVTEGHGRTTFPDEVTRAAAALATATKSRGVSIEATVEALRTAW